MNDNESLENVKAIASTVLAEYIEYLAECLRKDGVDEQDILDFKRKCQQIKFGRGDKDAD